MINEFISLFFPDCCVHCNESLVDGEKHLCTSCRIQLPYSSNNEKEREVILERFVFENRPTDAYSLLKFHKKGITQSLLHELKYKGQQTIGNMMGEWLATRLIESNHWPGIDFIVPVPLHKSKLRQRGFNQSACFGQGIAEVSNTEMKSKLIRRIKPSDTQTKKSRLERWKNVESIFELTEPKLVNGSSILLIDDVLTTGATMEACIQCLKKGNPLEIYVAVVAVAQ